MTTKPILCPYCSEPASLVTGAEVYPHRDDLRDKPVYRCEPCDAHVGCHPGTTNPLGRLANANLRKLKMAAHAAFDPIWKSRQKTRKEAYQWLAGQLSIRPSECHIGWFDHNQCRRVVEVCNERAESAKEE